MKNLHIIFSVFIFTALMGAHIYDEKKEASIPILNLASKNTIFWEGGHNYSLMLISDETGEKYEIKNASGNSYDWMVGETKGGVVKSGRYHIELEGSGERIKQNPFIIRAVVEKEKLEISGADSWKTFQYHPTDRFMITLDSGLSPEKELKCNPEGIIKRTISSSVVQGNIYSAEFKGVDEGACALRSGSFNVIIKIKPYD